MRHVMVRYKVKPERIEEHEELVRAVYAELQSVEPEGLAYAAFKLEDGVSFIHMTAESGEGRLLEIGAFQRFLADLRARCDEPPVVTPLRKVGSFRAFELASLA